MKFAKSVCFTISLFPQILNDSFSTMEEEYTPEYCHELEAAYGKGLMSEGGFEGIEHMFEGISLEGKKALDIGSGLGREI